MERKMDYPEGNKRHESTEGPETKKYTHWMSELPAILHRVPLNQLAIPGSHDSFAFYLDKGPASMAPNMHSRLQTIVNLYFLGGLAKHVIHRWAVTQDKNFTEQLSLGIRYFDIRIAWNDVTARCKDGEAHFVHGLWGSPVKDAMEEIDCFLTNHPKEIIILDFKHFFNFTEEKHKKLLDVLLDIFGSKLCPFKTMNTVNLQMMWDSQYQVILRYAYRDINLTRKYNCWPRYCIPAAWPNTTDPRTAITFLESNYDIPRSCDQFFATQGILTPNGRFIAKYFYSTLKYSCVNVIHDPFLKWLENKKAGINGINICMMDYVEEDFVSVMMKLNMDLATELTKSGYKFTDLLSFFNS